MSKKTKNMTSDEELQYLGQMLTASRHKDTTRLVAISKRIQQIALGMKG